MTIGQAEPPLEPVAPRSPAGARRRAGLGRIFTARQARIVLAGYAVVVLASIGFVSARMFMPDETTIVALIVAAVIAAPPVLAMVGERITSIKVPGVELSLAAAAVSMSTSIPSDELNTINASGGGDLGRQLRRLIAAPGSQLLLLDLRDGKYWWPTRLYLLAALLSDHTDVRRLVFVEGRSRTYVGMADPKAIRLRIEAAMPGLDLAYVTARQQAIQTAVQPVAGVPQPARLDVAQIVEQSAWAWPGQVNTFRQAPETEQVERVSRSWLEHTLGADLHWAAIEVTGGPDGALLQYRLLTMQDDFIALVIGDRLTNVVSRARLSISIATAYLAAELAAR